MMIVGNKDKNLMYNPILIIIDGIHQEIGDHDVENYNDFIILLRENSKTSQHIKLYAGKERK